VTNADTVNRQLVATAAVRLADPEAGASYSSRSDAGHFNYHDASSVREGHDHVKGRRVVTLGAGAPIIVFGLNR